MSWRQVAAEQGGVISTAQLQAAGVNQAVTSGMGRRGELVRLSAAGVYLIGGAPWTEQARLWSAALITRGVLGFATGAHLWGMLAAAPPRIHVIVDHDRRPTRPGWVRLHRTFVPRSAVIDRDGLLMATRSWTALDLIGSLPRAEAFSMADRALQRGWMTATDIERRLSDFPGRTGNTMLRRVLARSSTGAAAESERRLHRLLQRAGIEGWRANLAVWSQGALVAVVDVAFEEQRLAVEVDGWAFHSDVDQFRRDRRRQNDLVQLGWTVLRFTWADLTERPAYVTRTIGEQLVASRD